MHDKKLTDKEIIKEATEAYNQNLSAGCYVGDLLRIINCLEARIGVYETCNARKDEAINRLEAKCEELQGIIVKYNSSLAKQVAENERLKTNLNIELDNFASDYDYNVKAEAYKEFAELVKTNKRKLFNYIYSSKGFDNQIDNLLKELVGENNA